MEAVDVALCTHNDASTLERAIGSVLKQDNLGRLFIVDDGSSDSTSEILKEYQKFDKITIITNKKNIGLAASLNKVLTTSTARYIARIDADDEMLPNRLTVQLEEMNKSGYATILGSNALVAGKRRQWKTEVPLDLVTIRKKLDSINCILHPTVIMDRQAICEIGGYDADMLRCQDYDLWIRAINAGYHIVNTSAITTKIWVRDKRSISSIFHEFYALLKISIKHKKFKIIYSALLSAVYNLTKI